MAYTDYIKRVNPWFTTGNVEPRLLGIRRKNYIDKIASSLTQHSILALTGIRRCGKSTLIFQTIQALLESTEAKKILYIKVDDIPELEKIEDILEEYQVLTGLDIKKDNCFIFIDEIQILKNWQQQLKTYIDYKYCSVFTVSGSSKTLIYKNATESLVGRIRFIHIFPLTFREFLVFSGISVPKRLSIADYRKAQEFDRKLHNKENIQFIFNNYLKVGAFPQWFEIRNIPEWRLMLRDSYSNLMLYRDIAYVYNVKNPKNLEKLFIYLSKNSANRFSYNKLSQALDMDKETIKLYLNYLESSGLVMISDKYTKKQTINERSEKKIYVWEEGLRKAVSLDDKDELEGVLAWHVQKCGLEENPSHTPYYHHDIYEVDYIYAGKEIIPIEVKDSSGDVKIKGLLEFMKKHKSKGGIIVTRNRLGIEDNVYYIPLWMFLLMIT